MYRIEDNRLFHNIYGVRILRPLYVLAGGEIIW